MLPFVLQDCVKGHYILYIMLDKNNLKLNYSFKNEQ